MTLFVSFAILAGLLLWAVTLSRGPWALKLALIVTVPLYGFIVWHSIDQWRGYPVPARPPQGSALVASAVDEPRAIFLWVVTPGSSEPRAYRIPYSRAAHQAVAAASSARGKGVHVGVRFNAGRVAFYVLPPALPPKGETP